MTRTRILIVEDEGIIARDIERLLASLDYEPVGIAVEGPGAIRMADELRPHLVLMDIHLAGEMDGIDAATAIRVQFGISSVFLTAYATDDVVERAKRAEPLGYVIKPFDQLSLRTTIEIALHKDAIDARLRQSEARYRAVVETANDAVITADPNGLIVGWSPAAEAMFGYSEAEAVGRPAAMLVPPRHLPGHVAGMERWRAAPHTIARLKAHEVDGRRSDGSEFPAELSLATWHAADRPYATAFVRDVSGRRAADTALRLQSAALNAVANGVVITDPAGVIEWVNPAFTSITGYTAEEAIGKNPRDLVKSGVHDAAFYKGMWDTLLSGRVWFGEMTNRRKDGTHYVEEQTITPLKDADGRITHFIAVKRDLTEQKQLQAQFLQSQKMEVVGRLAGGIAHDFNNLLTIINGESDLALLDLAADHPLRQPLEYILDAGNRAVRLTRQLLTFSRKQIAAPLVISVSTQVAILAQMLTRLIGEDIQLVIAAPPEPAADKVLIDPGQLEQLLLNLAVNARDAMPTGGTLTIATRVTAVDAAFAASHPGMSAGLHVVLTVTDTGVGMTADTLGHLFEPFFTTKRPGSGTGLGLAMVYGIVRQCGGGIVVDSVLGRGTSFAVFLPVAAGAANGPLAEQTTYARGTETILLVEDEDSVRELTARMLRSAGYAVVSASCGMDALALLPRQETPLHLLVTDVVMPGMSGPELALEVAKTHPRLPVLFTSGYTGNRLSPEATADPNRFLAKPFTLAQLTAKVRSVLDS